MQPLSDEAQPLLIWEDRGRSGANVAQESSDSDESSDSEDGEAPTGVAGIHIPLLD